MTVTVPHGVQLSIGPPAISGIPVDLAFDNLRNYAGLPGTSTPFTHGTVIPINGKQMVRGVCPGPMLNNSETRYLFVAVPYPVNGTGLVDVVRYDQGFARIDTNPYQPGVQSVSATNCEVLMDYFRQ